MVAMFFRIGALSNEICPLSFIYSDLKETFVLGGFMGFFKLCDCAMSTQRMRLFVILTIGVA